MCEGVEVDFVVVSWHRVKVLCIDNVSEGHPLGTLVPFHVIPVPRNRIKNV
jgi:hypothetical protein